MLICYLIRYTLEFLEFREFWEFWEEMLYHSALGIPEFRELWEGMLYHSALGIPGIMGRDVISLGPGNSGIPGILGIMGRDVISLECVGYLTEDH